MLEDLEGGTLEYETVGEFLAGLRIDFKRKDKEIVKVSELRKLEQKEKTIEEFVQEFRRIARESRYKGYPLVEEFKRDMNRTICQRLIKSE